MIFNTNENSISQQVLINKNNIDANTKAIELLGELDTEGIANLTADVASLKTTTTKNTDDIEVNKSNISQNSTVIDSVKITADSALSKTEYDEFVTIVTSGYDYVSIPALSTYKRLEIQYAGRTSSTGDYEYSASSVVQMDVETPNFFRPFVSLVWSSTTWSHIAGLFIQEDNYFYPLDIAISRGTSSSNTFISYGVKVTVRCYK